MPAPELAYTLEGDGTGDRLGNSVAWIEDVDGDGCDDLLAAAPGGYVRLYSGRDGSVLRTFTASCTNGDIGWNVAGAGDVDGDGVEDILAGNRDDGHGGVANTGSVWVFSGRDGATLHTFYGVTKSRLGHTLDSAGDVDGDGCADIIAGGPYATIGSETFAGEVCVFSGRDGATLYRYTGTQYHDSVGTFVRGAGDVNRDGRGDFLFSAGDYDPATFTFKRWLTVCSGRDGSTLLTIRSPSKVDPFFRSVMAGTDMNGDGYPDIAVGSKDSADHSVIPGAVWVFSGRDGSILREYHGEPGSNECVGASLSSGDADGDGVPELAVGCANGLRNLVGEVRIYSGNDGTRMFRFEGFAAGEDFGAAISLSGDGDGDGRADLAVGAPCGWPFAPDKDLAQVYVYLSPGPAGALSIEGGAAATASRSVDLSLSWTALETEVEAMRLRDRDEAWGEWRPLSSALGWTLPAGEGPKTVFVEYRDAGGLRSGPIPAKIALDESPPVGTVSIEDGAEWTSRRDARVAIDFADRYSEVAGFRLRNRGGPWTDWLSPMRSVPWTLPGADGPKTIEAEVRDLAGNVSPVAADSIGLDTTPPTGSLVIAGGAEFVTTRDVKLTIPAHDGAGSGLHRMRLRHLGWPDWYPDVPFAEAVPWTLTPLNGTKAVDVVLTDLAGNESAVVSASVIYDDTPPAVDGIWVNQDRPYVLPEEPVCVVVYAHDNPEGSGVAALRATAADGADWSPWVDVRVSSAVEAGHPAAAGLHALRAMAKDRAGNESAASEPTEKWFLEASPPLLGAGGKAAGKLPNRREVDAIALDLVRGNLLSLQVRVTPPSREETFPLVMDLARPAGKRWLERIGPEGFRDWLVPETGRYFLVLRAEGEGAESAAYAISVSGKQAPENAKGRWAGEGSEVQFEAAAGSRFTASVRGLSLDPTSVVLEGPDGPVETVLKGKPGSAKLTAVLDRGTGTYRLRFAAEGPAQVAWAVKPPASRVLVEE